MKKYVVVIAILCFSIIVSCFICKSNAIGFDSVKQDPEAYIQGSGDDAAAIEIGNIIIWLVRTIGESIAVIMLLIIGIKYLMGSVEEKAEYKQSMWPYILGAILIFAGSAVTELIYNAFNQ